MNGLALCAGAAGLELGLRLALGESYRCVAYVEREAYAAATLVARMADKALDPAPVWDDLATFDGRPWRGVAVRLWQMPMSAEDCRSGRPVATTPRRGRPYCGETRVLNPRFVEWLMGWPIGWTDCGSPVTEWSQWWQQWRSWLSERGYLAG